MVQKQLSAASQTAVRLTVLVEIGCLIEAPVLFVQVEYTVFADVEEESGVDAASDFIISLVVILEIADLPLQVLVTAAQALFVAARSLTTENISAE